MIKHWHPSLVRNVGLIFGSATYEFILQEKAQTRVTNFHLICMENQFTCIVEVKDVSAILDGLSTQYLKDKQIE